MARTARIKDGTLPLELFPCSPCIRFSSPDVCILSATTVSIAKGTPNAQKVLASRRGNVSGGNAVTKVENGDFREMVSNLMEPNHPYLLPRTVPTSAAVIFHKPQISLVKNLEEEAFGVMVVRPSVENTVSYTTTGVSTIDPKYVRVPENSNCMEEFTSSLYLDPTLETDSGYFSADLKPGSVFVIEPDGSTTSGVPVFQTLGWSAGASITVKARIDFAGAPLNAKLFLGQYGGAQLASTADVLVTPGQETNFSLALPVAQAPVPLFIGISFTPAGTKKLCNYFYVSLSGFSSGAVPGYKTSSLWDMLGNVSGASLSRQQYYNAEKYSITGFSALLRNTTASQYKSGSVVAAQLPGGSEHLIPQNPEEAYRFIASYNDPKTYSGQLNKGVHWFFSPEKVQDWFFRSTEDPLGERPYLAIAWSGVAANDLANMLGLTLDLRINIELLTTDISLMKFMPTPDLARLFDLYITMVNAHNSLGENPGHLAKIKKITQSILNNPYTKDALRAAAKAGSVMLPLALAAI